MPGEEEWCLDAEDTQAVVSSGAVDDVCSNKEKPSDDGRLGTEQEEATLLSTFQCLAHWDTR